MINVTLITQHRNTLQALPLHEIKYDKENIELVR